MNSKPGFQILQVRDRSFTQICLSVWEKERVLGEGEEK